MTLVQRDAVKRRVVLAARVQLSSGSRSGPRLLDDVCLQLGIHRHALDSMFASEDMLLDAVNDSLVDDCAERLSVALTFVPSPGCDPLAEAALALGRAWPLDRGSIMIRSDRRLKALRSSADGGPVAAAERRFVGALEGILGELIQRIGRRFSWPQTLAVRVILDTYERSFEMWLIQGNRESEFDSSPYVRRTLPTLLREMTELTELTV